MHRDDRERRRIIASIRGYYEIAWRRHGATRYLSALLVPAAIAAVVPGWQWAAASAALLLLAMGADIASERYLAGAFARLGESATLGRAIRMRGQLLAAASVIVSGYAAPSLLLAFAPAPGPAIGFMFCLTALVLLASQHVMTRNMILYTVPVIALATVLNATALAQGWHSVAMAALAILTVLNAVKTTRAGAVSFADLIDARLEAEAAAQVLEQRVAERTAELAEATRAAVAANQAKSAFLANMSHELRTPLNAVIGYAELVEEDLDLGETEDCAAHLGKIRNAGKHLLGLIGDVLDLAKIEADKLTIAAEQVATAPAARAALDAVAPLAAANRTSCDLIVEPGAEYVYADPARLRQCLINLLSNAAKFTHDGLILVRIRRCANGDDGAVAFDVRDTGIGMSETVQAQLFQPFVQADASITRSFGGTGLGLSITRRLAHMMDGEVTLESVEGAGSCFTLTLPARPPLAANCAEAA